jgi:hypothetical protein
MTHPTALLLCLIQACLFTVFTAATLAAEQNSLAAPFTEGKFDGTIRAILFNQDFADETNDRTTLGIGGNLRFETAPLYGFSAGVGVKTGQGDNLNDDEVYRGILAIGENLFDAQGYTAIDEYYLRYSNWSTSFTLGAQEINTPWLSAHDIRVTPKKYRGVGIINNAVDGLALHGYYIADWLSWTEESWSSISSALTIDPDDEGALIVGGVWQVPETLKLQAWNYYYNEVVNNFYVVGDYANTLAEEYTVSASLLYFNQADVGDALGGEISTYTTGGNIGIAAYGLKLTGYYGRTGQDPLRVPFGGRWIISMQVNNLERADEEAWGLQLGYDFAHVGLPRLSAYFFHAGFDTPDSGSNISPDFTESDFDLQYRLSGRFENCSIRLRYAYIDEDEDVDGGEDYSDGRIYLQYRF